MVTKRNGRNFLPPHGAPDIEIELPPPVRGEDQSLYDKILSGTEKIFSLPEQIEDNSTVLKTYLTGFRGKKVCVALWDRACGRCEKCGILREVGSDYIAIHEPRNGRLIITNMEKIKYISVFCV